MLPPKMGSSIKPTLDTKFHIDYVWWDRGEENLRQYLLTHLPANRRDYFQTAEAGNTIDYVDAETAEVRHLDELEMAIQDAAHQPDFINPQTSLIDSVFRVFLANSNRPRSPRELATDTGRNADTILKTLGTTRIYRGLRPYTSH